VRTIIRSLAISALIALVPGTISAQDRQSRRFERPSWNISIHGGFTQTGQFLLQRPNGTVPENSERSLRTDGGYDFGGALGVDVMPRVGIRTSYTYAQSEFRFRDDTGDGSDGFDVNDAGKLGSHFATLELITYMLRARAPITPYASAGFAGAWWVLDEDAQQIQPGGARTEFRTGAVATLGLQAALGATAGIRLEAVTANVRNPFGGRESFRALGGTTIDEPNRVSKTDYRLAIVYRFGGAPQRTASRRR
jgi:hypothetical protein